MPYRKYGGLRFLEAAHVKDFVSAARLLDNSHDEVAWYRLLRLHDRLGPSSARSMTETILASDETRSTDGPRSSPALRPPPATRYPAPFTPWLTARANTAPGRAGGRSARGGAPPGARPVRGRRACASLDLERLVGAAAGAPDLAAWLAEVILDPPASTGDLAGPPALDEDYVIISTIHSAKGLEWSIVHIPQVIDGSIPIDMALGSAHRPGRGTAAFLRRGHAGARRATPLHAAANAAPSSGQGRPAQLRRP